MVTWVLSYWHPHFFSTTFFSQLFSTTFVFVTFFSMMFETQITWSRVRSVFHLTIIKFKWRVDRNGGSRRKKKNLQFCCGLKKAVHREQLYTKCKIAANIWQIQQLQNSSHSSLKSAFAYFPLYKGFYKYSDKIFHGWFFCLMKDILPQIQLRTMFSSLDVWLSLFGH